MNMLFWIFVAVCVLGPVWVFISMIRDDPDAPK